MTKIDIISGFLGAGKTTLIKKLLQEAFQEEQVVLIENEFGEIGIDGGFLKEAGIEIREMNSGPSLLNIGVGESALQGNIAATETGKFAGPLKGNRGILVYQVEDVNMEGRPFNERDYGSRFNQTFGIIRQGSPLPLLLGKDKVDNRSLNFVQSLGED